MESSRNHLTGVLDLGALVALVAQVGTSAVVCPRIDSTDVDV
jgi:hypothetical protein